MANQPSLLSEFIDGTFHVGQIPAQAASEVLDSRAQAGIAKTEAEDVDMDGAPQQDGKEGLRHVGCHAPGCPESKGG